MRRRIAVVACLLTLTIAGFAVAWWSLLPRSPIDRAAYDRIQEKMSLADVERIIGLPPGYHSTKIPGPIEIPIDEDEVWWKAAVLEVRREWWTSDASSIGVALDVNGIVIGKMYQQREPDSNSIVQRLLDSWDPPQLPTATL